MFNLVSQRVKDKFTDMRCALSLEKNKGGRRKIVIVFNWPKTSGLWVTWVVSLSHLGCWATLWRHFEIERNQQSNTK